MSHHIGIALALLALLSWGFGDFFIQKTTRILGSWKALFFIGLIGSVVLFPFSLGDIISLNSKNLTLLSTLGLVVIVASLFNFEALRRGKMAIIEPVIGLELPITVGLSVIFIGESLSFFQIFFIGFVFIGIILAVTTRQFSSYYSKMLEKGVVFAVVSAMGMALANFLVGVSSQSLSPLISIWFAHSALAVFCGAYIIANRQLNETIFEIRKHAGLVVKQGVLYNMAWVSFAQATTYIPISIATAISENYIVLAIILGIFINKEKIKIQQIIGVILATIGVIALSYIS
jgi:bacterial/archaeal transporter family protein